MASDTYRRTYEQLSSYILDTSKGDTNVTKFSAILALSSINFIGF